MNKLFDGYGPWYGKITQINSGALISDRREIYLFIDLLWKINQKSEISSEQRIFNLY